MLKKINQDISILFAEKLFEEIQEAYNQFCIKEDHFIIFLTEGELKKKWILNDFSTFFKGYTSKYQEIKKFKRELLPKVNLIYKKYGLVAGPKWDEEFSLHIELTKLQNQFQEKPEVLFDRIRISKIAFDFLLLKQREYLNEESELSDTNKSLKLKMLSVIYYIYLFISNYFAKVDNGEKGYFEISSFVKSLAEAYVSLTQGNSFAWNELYSDFSKSEIPPIPITFMNIPDNDYDLEDFSNDSILITAYNTFLKPEKVHAIEDHINELKERTEYTKDYFFDSYFRKRIKYSALGVLSSRLESYLTKLFIKIDEVDNQGISSKKPFNKQLKTFKKLKQRDEYSGLISHLDNYQTIRNEITHNKVNLTLPFSLFFQPRIRILTSCYYHVARLFLGFNLTIEVDENSIEFSQQHLDIFKLNKGIGVLFIDSIATRRLLELFHDNLAETTLYKNLSKSNLNKVRTELFEKYITRDWGKSQFVQVLLEHIVQTNNCSHDNSLTTKQVYELLSILDIDYLIGKRDEIISQIHSITSRYLSSNRLPFYGLWISSQIKNESESELIFINSLCLDLEKTILFYKETLIRHNFLQANTNKKTKKYTAQYKVLTIDANDKATLNNDALNQIYQHITNSLPDSQIEDYAKFYEIIEAIVQLRNDAAHGKWELILSNSGLIQQFIVEFIFRLFVIQALREDVENE